MWKKIDFLSPNITLYYREEDKHYEWKEHNIIIEEMTYEEVDKIFGHHNNSN